jgi:transposase
MLGKRAPQDNLFTPAARLRKKIGEESFYVFLGDHRHEIFRDEDFAMLYCSNNGRASVPPSLLAAALILQTYTRVSDEEATERAQFDQRWQAALGLGEDDAPFAKSTLCLFRNQLILHDQAKLIFIKGLNYLRRAGFIKKRKLSIALDTTPIFGKGAVQDTYNMLAEGLYQVLRVLASLSSQSPEAFAADHDFTRYVASSFKATHPIDWDDESERSTVLNSVVADCRRVLAIASQQLKAYRSESEEAERISTATELLRKLLVQDVREAASGKAELIQGVAPDRIVSVHDTQMRHGRKSVAQRFDGYKAAIAIEPESQVIADVDVLPANAHDSQNAPALIEQAATNLEAPVETVLGDTAYGTVEARLDAQKYPYDLVAPVSRAPRTGRFTKDDFVIDLPNEKVTCPNGQSTSLWYRRKVTTRRGTTFLNKGFRFGIEQCRCCPIRTQCIEESTPYRSLDVHEHEALIQQAKAFQRTETYRSLYRSRVVAEHRIARLVWLGIRNARYVGSTKTLFQLAMAAAVANLSLFATHLSYEALSVLLQTLIGVVMIVAILLRIDQRHFNLLFAH